MGSIPAVRSYGCGRAGCILSQAGVLSGSGREDCRASFDMAAIVYSIDPDELKHPLSFYIPKTESAEEGLWWRDVFRALARAKGLPEDYIKCMALVESHPLAYQMEEFAFNLKDHILGLNLGRWDYMASLIHFNLYDPGGFCRTGTRFLTTWPFFKGFAI